MPLLVIDSLLTQAILKGSPPPVRAGPLVFVEYLSGPSPYVEWTNWSKILASYSDMYTTQVILKGSPPPVRAGLLVFVEYLSGPSPYVEWTNWSKILASYSDMYTSPGLLT